MKFRNQAFDEILDDRSDTYSSTSTSNLLLPGWMKRLKSKKCGLRIAMIAAICLIILIIIVTAVVVTQRKKEQSKTLSITQDGRTIFGFITITNKEYVSELNDTQSEEFNSLKKEICDPIIETRSGVKHCSVKEFWKGSVMALFELKVVDTKMVEITDGLKEDIKQKKLWKNLQTKDEVISFNPLHSDIHSGPSSTSKSTSTTQSTESSTTSTTQSSTITSTSTSASTSTTTSTSASTTTSTTASTTASTSSSTSQTTKTSTPTTSTQTSTTSTASTPTTSTTVTSTRTTPSTSTSTASSTTTSSFPKTPTTPQTPSTTQSTTSTQTSTTSTVSSSFPTSSTRAPTVPTTTTPTVILTPALSPYANVTGRIRLAGGNSSSEGRLEVFFKGVWGTVCDDGFGPVDATIACKSMGFGTGTELGEAYFGEGEGRIWLDDMRCAPDDINLYECAHEDWGINDCSHAEDVGVRCQQPTNLTGSLRLSGGDTPYAGRLEVQIDGVWGSVCDDFINDTVAEIFCKALGIEPELGFKPQAIGGAFFGEADPDAPIWYDDVHCPYVSMGISGCSMYQEHNCRHHEDVSLVCREEAQVQWEVRLVDSKQNGSGHIQVRSSVHKSWGYVCDDYWNTRSAGLACKDLGYGGIAIAHTGSYFHNLTYMEVTPAGVQFALDDVLCDDTMTSLRHCSHLPWGKHNCKGNEIAGVSCLGNMTSTIRLVGGKESSGRVEVFYNQQWGTVCDDDFENVDAAVICRTLGYDAGIVLNSVPSGSGRIWLDDLDCQPSDTSIYDCGHDGWGSHNCAHSEDAGVSCYDVGRNASGSYLFFTDTRRKNVFQMPLTGGDHIPVGGSTKFVNPVAITYDPIRNFIYWTERAGDGSSESKYKSIGQLSLVTNEIQTIPLPTDSIPDGLSIDPLSNLLYMTDTANNLIKIIDFKRKTNKTLVRTGLLEPRAIVVDPVDGWMYWSDWGSPPDIEKAEMDGTNRKRLVTSGLRWPNGLALDKPAERLYFCEAKSPRSVQSISTNGTDRKTHFSTSSSNYNFFGIAVDEQYIYLTTWSHRYIHRLSKTAIRATSLERLGATSSSSARLNALVIVGSSYQKMGKNKCYIKNGGCSHYCLPVPSGRVCACPDSMELKGTQCQEEIITTTSTVSPTPTYNHNYTGSTFGYTPGFGSFPPSPYGRPSASLFTTMTTDYWTTTSTNPIRRLAKLSIGTGPPDDSLVDIEDTGQVITRIYRLFEGSDSSEGRVEVAIGGVPGRVCAEDFNFKMATEVCTSLGYDYGIPYTDGYFGKGNGSAFISHCKPVNGTFDDCLQSDCPNHDAGVACYGGPDNTSAVRLTGGKDETEGRIEVVYKGRWGVMCDDTWNHHVADIVCKMLGYVAGAAERESHFGATNKTIWLDTVYCDPYATNLFACNNDPWGVTDCDNFEEAGAKCISDFSSVISLVGNSSRKDRGVVSIRDIFRQKNESGPLCATADVGRMEVEVICRMLGFLSGQLETVIGSNDAFSSQAPFSWIISGCSPEANSLYDCELRRNQARRCLANKVTAVRCSNDAPVETLLNCTFESSSSIGSKACPLRNVNRSAYKFYRRRGSSFGSSTGPCYDHTQTRRGYYMCIRPSLYGRYLNPGILESKQFYTEKESCLTFRYHMYGTGAFYLKVYANYSDDGVNKTFPILDVSDIQGDIWRHGEATLPPGRFSVVFEASSNSSSGNTALDDIYLDTERCSTNTTEFFCDFERGLCNITSGSCNSYMWKHLQARRISNLPYDHSLQTSNGYVMNLGYIYRAGYAYFTLPYMNLTRLTNLRFYYFYNYFRVTTSVLVKARYLDGSSVLLWELSQEDLSGKWNIAEALIPSGFLQIEFSGDIRRGNFAVDDISVTSLENAKYVENMTCNFDQGNMCSLTNMMIDHGDWKVRTPKSRSSASDKPCKDYTLGSVDGGFIQTSLRGRDEAVDLQFPNTPDILQTQHRLQIGRSVGINLPQIYVRNQSCLTFFIYMQTSNTSGVIVNTTSGIEWWVMADQTRTWREVAVTLPFGLHIVSVSFFSVSQEVHTAALDGISVKPGSCNEARETGGDSLICNFDEGSMCSWISSCPTNSGVKWNLGTTESEGLATDDDFTPGTFAFVKDTEPGQHALVSRSSDLEFDMPHCLTFKYWLTGGAALEVKLGSYQPRREDVLIWKQNRTTTKWLTARAELNGISNVSRIIIEARSKQSGQFLVAVDSIDIINGTCPIEINTIQLYNGQDRRSGKLQIDMNGMWHEVCLPLVGLSNAVKQRFAKTVCRVLGHWPLTFDVELSDSPVTSDVPILPGYLNCSDDSPDINNCTYTPCKRCCRGGRDTAVIRCHTEKPVLRLTGGNRLGEGFLEIYSGSEFIKVRNVLEPSIVCLHLFGSERYDTQKTYPGPHSFFRMSHQVNCTNATDITECKFIPLNSARSRMWMACLPNVTSDSDSVSLESPSCDFEEDLCNYQQDYSDHQDWQAIKGLHRRTVATGPDHPSHLLSAEHDTFLLFEASSPSKQGFTARISTPKFDSTNKCLRFVYNLRGIGGSLLHVFQMTSSETILLSTFNQTFDSGYWMVAVLKLNPSTTSWVTFEAVRGIHSKGDVAIDDVEITDNCTHACPGDSFKCSDDTCIPSFKICDNVQDCNGTLSEEIGCACKAEDDFQCANGICIPGASKCDGIPSCDEPDFSDEKHCTCQPEEFKCQNDVCILPHLICDGQNQCGDWSDEKISLCKSCGDESFLCPGSAEQFCIDNDKRCDGEKHCFQTGADEKNCVNCTFNDKNTCNLKTYDAFYFALNSNSSTDYYAWTRYFTELDLAPIESTSCLRLQVFNSRYDYITISENVFNSNKRVTVERGSWIDVEITLEVLQPFDNAFEIKMNNASIDNVTITPGKCPEEEPDIISCNFSTGMCGFQESGWQMSQSERIRLVDGSASSGRLEVFVNGTWGTVCHIGFSNIDATVACRTLGYRNGRSRCCAHYGQGRNLPIHWRSVSCPRNQTDIFQCSYSDPRYCSHTQDVGVQCSLRNRITDNHGQFFLEASSKKGYNPSMITKQVSGMKCMHFQYKIPQGAFIMAGGLDIRQRNPYTSRFFGGNATTITSFPPSNDSQWKRAEVSLHPEAEHVFIIASYLEKQRTAIANLTISKVKCSNATNQCEDDYIPCNLTMQCYPKTEQCNGLAFCMDNSDEWNCSSENYHDFTNGILGGNSGNLLWIVTSGNTPTEGTGAQMSRDHLPHLAMLPLEGIRLGNIRTLDYSIPQMRHGKYIYSEMSGGQPGDQAVLHFNTSAKCMRFHYSAVGDEDSSLAISVNGDNIWNIQAFMTQDNKSGILSQSGWNFAQVNLSAAVSDIRFIATRGQSNLGDFALDDIVFLNDSCPDAAPCPEGRFSCGDGSCIDSAYKCDNIRNCGSGVDESIQLCKWARTTMPSYMSTTPSPLPVILSTTAKPGSSMNSSNVVCRPDQFQCTDGYCINGKYRCDFWDHCLDGSDEAGCQSKECDGALCETGYCVQKHSLETADYKCSNAEDKRVDKLPQKCSGFECDGFCLPWSSYCDGTPDCRSKEDEHNFCQCRGDVLTCDDGTCKPLSSYCDTRKQCSDGSDEPPVCECFEETNFRCGSGECIKKSERCDLEIQCPDGSDEANCTCTFGQFECADGRCINDSKVCDGIQHCFDGSDEPGNCECLSDQFDCGDRCIPLEKQCDGVSDCSSFQDELNCNECRQKSCTDGTCIMERMICDSVPQCNDGKDESYCKCKADEFPCKNGACIPLTQKCDLFDQCGDFSDEMGCDCGDEMIKCNSTGNCIDKSFLCDGFPDCLGSEDEQDCPESVKAPGFCPIGQILCNRLFCVPGKTTCKNSSESRKYLETGGDPGRDCGKAFIGRNDPAGNTNISFTTIHSWPWHVDILYKGKSRCSGVLIDRYWILADSHCIFHNTNPDDYRFNLGSSNRINPSPERVTVYSSAFYLNKEWNVFLIRISSQLTLSDYINPICLPKTDEDNLYVNSTSICFTAGYETTYNNVEVQTEYLKEQRIAGDFCSVDESMLSCDLPLHCMSEIGAPLFCLQTDGRWSLQGIQIPLECDKNRFLRTSTITGFISNVIKESQWKN